MRPYRLSRITWLQADFLADGKLMMSAVIRFEQRATATSSFIEPATRLVRRFTVMAPISTTWKLRIVVGSCRELAFLSSRESTSRESLGLGASLTSIYRIEKPSCMAYHFKPKSCLFSDLSLLEF